MSALDCAPEDWVLVGSSKCLWTIYSLDCVIVRDGLYDTSQVRDELQIVNLRAAWFQEFSLVMRGLFIIVGCWGPAVLALCGGVDAARRFHGMYNYHV